MNTLARGALLGSLALIAALPAAADVIFDVTLDTRPLIGNAAQPFFVNFQLNDGTGEGDANNSVAISNFAFGGGEPVGPAILFGGAVGNLAGIVRISDTNFTNLLIQEFVPGDSFSFTVRLTTNVDVGLNPDQFS